MDSEHFYGAGKAGNMSFHHQNVETQMFNPNNPLPDYGGKLNLHFF